MKFITPLAAHLRAIRGLSATLLGALLAWATLSGCSSSGGAGPSSACKGAACVATKAPCSRDADCDSAEFCAQGVCRADVCTQGKADCDAKSGGLRVCADNGSRSDLAPCPASQSCTADDANGAVCQPWLCTPGQPSCTNDGKAIQTCADDGLSYGKADACSKGTSCVSGKCVTITCTPNQLFCQDGGSYVCAGDGASATLLQACDSVSFCEAESGQCRSKPCSPGQSTCIDGAAATCNADGTGYDRTLCAVNEVCDSGSCVPMVCAPNEVYCDSAQSAMQCNSTGTVATTYTTCTSGTHCNRIDPTRANCLSDTCTPGADVCDGTRATVCKMDGTGAAPGGTDCAVTGGTCSAGQCKAQVCTPNQRFCSDKSVYSCLSDGSGSTLYAGCAAACNPATAYCSTQYCTPNATTCSGNSVVQCDANGVSNAVVQNCGTTNQVCVAGKCQPVVCTANTPFCKNGNGYTCNSDGTASALSSVCSTGSYCSSGYCYTNACVPGAPVCNGTGLTTCKADGSGPVGAGSACANGSVCDNGACKPTLCTANSLFCSSGDVRLCNAQGDGSTAYQHCFSDAYCSNGACLPDLCPNGAPYCSGEVLESCKADGSGPVNAGTDCAASGKACAPSGCSTTIVDAFGASSSQVTDTVIGEIIRTQKARKLTRVEMDSSGISTIKNTIVYSSTDGVNFYLLANAAAPASASFPAGFNDSGPLSVELQANTYYLIGENLSAGAMNYGDPAGLTPLSFATVLKAVFFGGTFTSPSSFIPDQTAAALHMRLTTALP